MLRLAIVVEGETQYSAIRDGVATLGSSRDNDVVIHCKGVSRRHALVDREGQRITITDAGSKNGLFVLGVKVRAVTLEKGMDVCIGRAIVRLHEIDTADAEIAMLLDTLTSSRSAPLDMPTETLSPESAVLRELLRFV